MKESENGYSLLPNPFYKGGEETMQILCQVTSECPLMSINIEHTIVITISTSKYQKSHKNMSKNIITWLILRLDFGKKIRVRKSFVICLLSISSEVD